MRADDDSIGLFFGCHVVTYLTVPFLRLYTRMVLG